MKLCNHTPREGQARVVLNRPRIIISKFGCMGIFSNFIMCLFHTRQRSNEINFLIGWWFITNICKQKHFCTWRACFSRGSVCRRSSIGPKLIDWRCHRALLGWERRTLGNETSVANWESKFFFGTNKSPQWDKELGAPKTWATKRCISSFESQISPCGNS